MPLHKIVLKDVSRFEAARITQELGDKAIEVEERKLPDGTLGDLGLGTVTVIIGLAALNVIALYLLRTHGEESWTVEIEGIDENGNRTTQRVVYRRNNSEAPSKTVIDALKNALNIDLSTLLS